MKSSVGLKGRITEYGILTDKRRREDDRTPGSKPDLGIGSKKGSKGGKGVRKGRRKVGVRRGGCTHVPSINEIREDA